MHILRNVFACSLLMAAVACGGSTPNPPPPPSNKTISGTITLATSTNSATAPFVENEVIVKFKSGITAQNSINLSVAGANLTLARAVGLEHTRLFRATTNSDARVLAEQLSSRVDVVWAQPNYILQKAATSNDEFLNFQWHYPAINLPQAWDIEKGDSNPVTVAVIDTGILKTHPDFAGKIIGGFDFVSNARNSRDGDGRDADANDPGDNPSGQSSYHGSHVAGTIAAATNNSIGIAGISWGAKILPIRVLGVGGGTIVDIVDGMVWAAGLPVSGMPNNPNPAAIINMSLGGSGACSQNPAYQEAIDQVNSAGKIIVVAAGNSNQDASSFVPASCSGVITVGATDFAGARAPYSNFGQRIDVVAPGGDVSADLNNDTRPDGVLSLGKNDQTGNFNFIFENGTSMAAPHVAGVLALMKSRDPSLTLTRALEVLKRTARELTPTKCTGSGTAKTSSDCGAGLIDAQAALQALSPGNAPTPDFSLRVNPTSLRVVRGSSVNISITAEAVGGFDLSTVAITFAGAPSGVTLTATGSTVQVNVPATVAPDSYSIVFEGTGAGLTRTATLTLTVTAAPTQAVSINGSSVLACFYVAATDSCDVNKSVEITVNGTGLQANYSISNLSDGNYIVFAGKDVDGNNDINSGDFLGVYTVGFVRPPASNIGIRMSLLQNITQLASMPTETHFNAYFKYRNRAK